jgi:hypothetical protein
VLDDFLVQILGEKLFGRLGQTPRARRGARLFFGVLGAALGVIGAVHFATRPDLPANLSLRASITGTFVALTCVSLFNIGLARSWRWPGLLFIGCFVAMFVTRIVLGP